jgi:hypothetical protein
LNSEGGRSVLEGVQSGLYRLHDFRFGKDRIRKYCRHRRGNIVTHYELLTSRTANGGMGLSAIVEDLEGEGSMRTIYLIACADKKASHATAARNLYLNKTFAARLRYAEHHKPDAIYILSALHGLLPLDTVVEPYDCKLDDASLPDWIEKVFWQLHAVTDTSADKFVFLASGKYTSDLLTERLEHHELPFKGVTTGWPLLNRLRVPKA